MPYDPGILRTVLSDVTDKANGGLELKEVLRRVKLHLDAERKPVPKPWLHTTTLSRFIKAPPGSVSRRRDAFEAIWDYLANTTEYKPLFQRAYERPQQAPVEDAFLFGMTQLFREPSDIQTIYDLQGHAQIGKRFVGAYAFYRPSWRSFAATGDRFTPEISISLLEISETLLGYYSIAETQNYPSSDTREAYIQYDRGCLAALGKYIYFLMKEKSGTSVKFGVIQNTIIETSGGPVDWFSGILYSSSAVAFYAPVKFYCRRVRDPKNLSQGPVELREIRDRDARDYLRIPFKLPENSD